MKSRPTPSSSAKPWPLLGSWGLAALGQAFLVRQDIPWTAAAGLALDAVALFLFISTVQAKNPKPGPPLGFSRGRELGLLLLIFGIALFFRLYRLSEFPAGIFPDDACAAYGALRILHEGWRPFSEIFSLHAAAPSIYYELALWFKFFSPTQAHLFGFSVFISTLTLGFCYGIFRKLAGVPTALLALFILAVMRWDVTFSRNAHLCVDVPFYLSAALFFWLHALSPGRRWAFALSAAFFAAGFYSYTAYYAFIPLVLLFAVYEIRTGKKNGNLLPGLALFFILSFALALPMLLHIALSPDHGNLLGASKDRLYGFLGSLAQGDFSRLPGQLAATAQMFNRRGDPWYLNNLPGHRLLDDVTGVLWILGFGLGWFRLKDRKYFYALMGFGVMCLPAFLSDNPAQSGRALGAAPFLALLAALALSAAGERLKSPQGIRFCKALLATALGLMAWQNFDVYFFQQAGDENGWRSSSADASLAGKRIAESGGMEEVYVASRFFHHYDLLFLDYSLREDIYELILPESLAPVNLSPTQGLLFALDEGKTGVLKLLEDFYPDGKLEKACDLDGNPIVYFYQVDAPAAAKDRDRVKGRLARGWGLTGTYYRSMEAKGPPALVRTDLVLNFTFRNDFPLEDFPPLTAVWTGTLGVPASGTYGFLALTTDSASLKIDSREWLTEGRPENGEVFLKKGFHSINVVFKKNVYTVREEGEAAAFTLLWRKPGDLKYEVIPYGAFRRKP